MQTQRENIYATLFQLLQQAYPWGYSSRRMQMWDSMNTGQQPAMFMRQLAEQAEQLPTGAGLTRWHLKVEIWVYIQAAPNADEPGNFPGQTMNPILDALDVALRGNVPGSKQTLAYFNGGVPLVERCFIDGHIVLNDPVAPDTQIVMMIPVSITTGL